MSRRIGNLRFLMSFVAIVIILTGVFSGAIIAEGVPARPGIRTHLQKDGSVVSYQVIGDEFLNYIIDTNGNLLAFGEDEELCYADWISGNEFMESVAPPHVISGESVNKFHGFVVPRNKKVIGSYVKAPVNPLCESDMQPLKTPVPKYILEYAGKQMEERDASWRKWHNEKLLRDEKSAKSPVSSLAERNLVVFYVRFEDESNMPELQQKALSNTDIFNLVFNEVRQGSVAHYFKSVTDGGVKFIPAKETEGARDDGIIRVTIPGSNKNWKDDFPTFRKDVVTPALAKAAPFINLGDYSDGPNLSSEELSIVLIIHGYESANSSAPGVWGHASYGGSLGTIDNIDVTSYCAFGAFHAKGTDPQPFTAGILVHELGHHSFGFYDLYNIGNNRTRGITDYWSVMGMGTWGALQGEANGSTPTGIDAYHLSTLFPPTATVSAADLASGQQFSLTGASQFIKLETAFPKQYFLLQPRGNVGYDRGIQKRITSWSNPSGGLMIYHIDEDKAPESTWHLGLNNDWEKHPFIDIEEAHGGQQHLQMNSSVITADDLFYGSKNKFDGSSDPNSNLYDNVSAVTQNIASGVSVSEITANVSGQNTPDGRVIVSFRVGANSLIGVPNINTSILPGGTPGVAYSQTLDASGATPITWSIENGALPTGLTLSNAGLIYGTPTAVGTFNFTVKAANAYSSVTKPLSIVISAQTGMITVQPKSVSIVVGETKTIVATVTQSGATKQTLTWKSDNTSVATVNASGIIRGVSAGKATISVSINNGESLDSCAVVVTNSKLMFSNPQYSTNLDYAASKMVDIKATDLEISGGKVIIKKSVTEAIAISQLRASSSGFEVVSLPWFEAAAQDNGVTAVKIPVNGKQLNVNYARNIMLLKILSGSVGEFLEYAGSEADYGDGRFTLFAQGSETPYSGYLNPNDSYDLVIFIKDGGKYDLDKTANGNVVGSHAIVSKTQSVNDGTQTGSGGGGGGCSTFGYFAFVLLGVVPLARRNKHFRA